jgi:hypothetical protein
MTSSSRLPSGPQSQRPSGGDFGELTQFLKGSIADDDSRHVSESMSELATRIEAIIGSLRENQVRTTVAPLLVELLTVLRAHRHLVIGLGLPWRSLYEYAGYLQALNNFRVLIGQWLLDGGPRSTVLKLNAEDFELVGWRTLADGMMLIDVYEQWALRDQQEQQPESGLAALSDPHVERAVQWWKKLGR